MELAGRIQPVLAIRRVFRLAGLLIAHRQRRPVDEAKRNFHVRARCVDHILLPHVPIVGILLGVEVDPIRENAQIRAHGDELLFPRRDRHGRHIRLHRSAVDIKHLVLHPAQRILRQNALHALDRLRRPPPWPRREQRIIIRRQILHVVKLPVRQLEVVVVSEKDLRHHGLLLSLRQLWCQHGLTSVSSCPADQKGSAALSPRGSA